MEVYKAKNIVKEYTVTAGGTLEDIVDLTGYIVGDLWFEASSTNLKSSVSVLDEDNVEIPIQWSGWNSLYSYGVPATNLKIKVFLENIGTALESFVLRIYTALKTRE